MLYLLGPELEMVMRDLVGAGNRTRSLEKAVFLTTEGSFILMPRAKLT